MFEFAWPSIAKGEVLDNYLAKGWFRCGSLLHTTDNTSIDGVGEYPVYWLRYKIEAVVLPRKNVKLIYANKDFEIRCRRLEMNNETDRLFKKYKKGIRFEINRTLDSILSDTSNEVFDTRVIEIRNKGCLIAAGIFDIGKNSVENIINFYDHSYAKHSLGKFLIISLYQYCKQLGLEYYYPGYYLPGQEVLGYKLFLDKKATEVYLIEQNTWISYYEFEKQIPHLIT
jgi:leucyl-tRNA---protein transferase